MGIPYRILICLFFWPSISADASEPLGMAVEELLELAKARNPELATMRYEAEAAAQRVDASSAFPDPSFRISLQDFTNKETGGTTTLVPSSVGSTYYRVMQPLPFWGERGLKQEIAEAESSQARGSSYATWSELAAKIKTDFAQYYFATNSLKLTREMLYLLEDALYFYSNSNIGTAKITKK